MILLFITNIDSDFPVQNGQYEASEFREFPINRDFSRLCASF